MANSDHLQLLEGLHNECDVEQLLEIKAFLKQQSFSYDAHSGLRYIDAKLSFLSDVKGISYQPLYSIEDCIEFFSKKCNIEKSYNKFRCKYGIFNEEFGCPVLETWGAGRVLVEKELSDFYLYKFDKTIQDPISKSILHNLLWQEEVDYTMDFYHYYIFGYKL
jgi:hypothetical protein